MADVKASFDMSTVDGQMKVFNAQNGASISMKELENGHILQHCTGIMQYQEHIEETGKESTVTVIFGSDDTSYASISETVAKAGEKLITFLENTQLESFNVKIVKLRSKAEREFLNIQLVG